MYFSDFLFVLRQQSKSQLISVIDRHKLLWISALANLELRYLPYFDAGQLPGTLGSKKFAEAPVLTFK
jgi:hypothetical protein